VISKAARLVKLFHRVIAHAREFHDGHFFILSFTTGYKGNFGTPDMDFGAGRDEIGRMQNYQSIEELLEAMLSPSCDCICLNAGREKNAI
jgi:hypothetical protein